MVQPFSLLIYVIVDIRSNLQSELVSEWEREKDVREKLIGINIRRS